MKALFDAPIVVIDTETTGFLSEPTAQPVEIGAVCLDATGQTTLGSLSFLIRPKVDDHRHDGTWDWHAKEKTGLTRELVAAHGCSVSAAHDLFLSWWDALGRPQVCAFNNDFDRPMLERLSLMLGDEAWAPCIMLAAMNIMGPAGALRPPPRRAPAGQRWKWPNAKEAMTFFGVSGRHRHRAVADARDEALILRAVHQHRLGR